MRSPRRSKKPPADIAGVALPIAIAANPIIIALFIVTLLACYLSRLTAIGRRSGWLVYRALLVFLKSFGIHSGKPKDFNKLSTTGSLCTALAARQFA